MASIFVQIPAYHDLELENTIKSIYLNCSKSHIINVGVHFNYYDHIPEIIDKCLSVKYDNGRVKSLINKAPHGLGTALSRYLANSFYDGEDYYLQLDSHMKLRKNWDEIIIQDFLFLREHYASKIAISAYPNMYTNSMIGPKSTYSGPWVDSPSDSNRLDMNDINWISYAIGLKIATQEDRCVERNITDNRHNNVSGAFIFSTGDINNIFTPLPNVIIEETILSMKLISSGFNLVGRIREVARHLGPHPYMLSLNGSNNIHDGGYEQLLLEYPRRLSRIDFSDLHPVSNDIDIVRNQLTGNPEEKYILFNGMSLNDYLELSDLEICS